MEHTVFIIGAGASKEVNLPTGNELKNKISELLKLREVSHYKYAISDPTIHESCKVHYIQKNIRHDIKPYTQASHIISRSLPLAISIDNFLDAHKGNEVIELCGKLAIIKSILDSERISSLYFSKVGGKILDFKSLENTWFNKFHMLLTENCQETELKERLKSVSFIVFNYDRCLEHFLYNSLSLYYNIPEETAAELVNSIQIYHPYGVVGQLPWQNKSLSTVEFGADVENSVGPLQLLQLAGQINTFTEGTNPKSDERMMLLDKLKSCHKIIFLGFGFHKLNMKLITPELKSGERLKATSILATAKGISNSDIYNIESMIKQTLGVTTSRIPNICLANDKYCSDFFDEYWRQLSFV